MMYSGIDLHKRTLAVHTLDDAGQVVRKANMPTHREAITAYFATLPGPLSGRRRVYRHVVLAPGPAGAPGD